MRHKCCWRRVFVVVVEGYRLLMEHGFVDYVDLNYVIEVSCPRNVLDKNKVLQS